MAYELRNTSVILDGRLKHVCKWMLLLFARSTTQLLVGVGLITYLPLRPTKGALEPERGRDREEAWPHGEQRGKSTAQGAGAGCATELRFHLPGPKITQPQMKLPSHGAQDPTLNLQLQNLTHHLKLLPLDFWKQTKKWGSCPFSWILLPCGEAAAYPVPKQEARWSYSPSSTSPCTVLLSQLHTRYPQLAPPKAQAVRRPS